MSNNTPDTIVLIHGLWMTPFAWEHWVTRYEARGFTRPDPRVPRHRTGRGRGRMRCAPTPPGSLRSASARSWTSSIALIADLRHQPIIMGHSLRRHVRAAASSAPATAAAGVSIDGAPSRASTPCPLSEVRSTMPGAEEPGQPAPCCPADRARSSTTRSPTPSTRMRPARPTSATRRRPRRGSCSRAAWRTSPTRRHDLRLHQRRPRPAAVHLRRRATTSCRRSCRSENYKQERQALRGDQRTRRVPRARPLHLRRAGLGSCRGLRARLGAEPHRR